MRGLSLAGPAALLVLASLASLHVGPAKPGLPEIVAALLGGGDPAVEAIARYRLVRLLAAAAIGAGLAAAGAGMQFTLRNPLVDPYLLGVSSGASLGALVAVVFLGPSPWLIQLLAFLGAVSAYLVAVGVSGLAGLTGASLIVVGVAVGYLGYSGSVLLMNLYPDRIPFAFSWLLGTVAYTTLRDLEWLVPLTLASLIVLAVLVKRVEALSLGEERAESLGAGVRVTRLLVVSAASLAASSSAAVAGPIGFVGLAAPWLARLLGESRYSRVLVASLLWGALLVVAGDLAARQAAAPRELPLTPLMSLIGAPLLAYLAVRGKRGW